MHVNHTAKVLVKFYSLTTCKTLDLKSCDMGGLLVRTGFGAQYSFTVIRNPSKKG